MFLLMSVTLAVGGWTDPSANPPGSNADLPINVSGTAQTKSGGLNVGQGLTSGQTGLNVVHGKLQVSDGQLQVNGTNNCDTIDSTSSGVFQCGVDSDFQTLSTSPANGTMSISGGNTVTVHAKHISGGTERRIPYQTAANTTGFSSHLQWIETNKELWIRDPAVGTSVIGVDSIESGDITADKFWGTDADISNDLAVTHDITSDTTTSNEFCFPGSLPSRGCRGGWMGLGDVIVVSDGDAGGHNISNLNTLNASTVVANKITVNTVDPVYTIGGVNYATYMAGMTGVKEETTGTFTMTEKTSNGYKYVIDFNQVEKGTDLWLFAKASNLKSNFDKLAVILTPSFDGRVWYEKNALANMLTILAVTDTINPEISYRLTAPRFDAAMWTNYNTDGVKGLLINE